MNPVAGAVRVTDRLEAREALRTNLLGSGGQADVRTLDCALIRSVVWALWRRDEGAHILAIMNMALGVTAAMDGEARTAERRAELRDALDELADAGDVIETDHGRWLPAPMRSVDIGGSDRRNLIVGGLPTGALPSGLRIGLTHRGASRIAEGDALCSALGIPGMPIDAWIGVGDGSLDEWADGILKSELGPFTDDGDERISIYDPKRTGFQRNRWTEKFTALSGICLALLTGVFGVRRYRLTEIVGGRIRRCGAALMPGEGRRLMYALDARAGNPVTVRLAGTADSITVTLGNELPAAERRLLSALGMQQPLAEGRFYPQVWHLDRTHERVVRTRFAALGINIIDVPQE